MPRSTYVTLLTSLKNAYNCGHVEACVERKDGGQLTPADGEAIFDGICMKKIEDLAVSASSIFEYPYRGFSLLIDDTYWVSFGTTPMGAHVTPLHCYLAELAANIPASFDGGCISCEYRKEGTCQL